MSNGKLCGKEKKPIKMNLQILGNTIPHLHCHLLPRYYGDFAPNGPLAPLIEGRFLLPTELEAQAARLLAVLNESS